MGSILFVFEPSIVWNKGIKMKKKKKKKKKKTNRQKIWHKVFEILGH